MTTTPKLTRRAALTAGAVLPLAAATAMRPGKAIADGHATMTPNATKYSFNLGDFEVSTLLVGTRTVEEPQKTFGMNVSPEEFETVSEANFIPSDKTQFFFTPTVVNTGKEVVLFDAGLNAAGTTAALDAAGLTTDDIDTVVITHMHGDHIGGLAGEDGTPTFANAN